MKVMSAMTNKIYQIIRFVLKPIFVLLFNPTIIGKENIPSTGSAIIAGNHKNLLDPLLVDISTPHTVYALGKKELFKGLHGIFFKSIGTIPVDQYSQSNKLASDTALDLLKKGALINISPEGRTNKTRELLLPFKYGAVALAKKSDSPVIPYTITGKYTPFFNHLKIEFYKPITLESKEVEEANKLLYETIKNGLQENMNPHTLSNKIISEYRGNSGSSKIRKSIEAN